ncbi:transmembrane 220 family protein [Fibrella aquatica]|uniref:transmembrane 220 family protein n=1 Tax=Fibrella aquatica TaxID=3242487 RepID=UPI003522396B
MTKVLPLVFAIVFVLFAGVQYNDPDPQIWVPIYGFAAMACIMAYARIGQVWFFGLMALIYGVVAIYQWPPAFEGFVLNEMGMKTVNIELAREAGGLAICALAMGIMAFLVSKRKKS